MSSLEPGCIKLTDIMRFLCSETIIAFNIGFPDYVLEFLCAVKLYLTGWWRKVTKKVLDLSNLYNLDGESGCWWYGCFPCGSNIKSFSMVLLVGNKFIFDDPYIQGQLGEAVARGVLNLTIPHKVTMQKLSDFVNQGRLSSEVYDLIEWFDRQIDGIKISDGEDNVKVELYEVKTRLTGFSMFTNSRRKPKVTDAVLELSEAAVKIGVPMNSVIVDFYPYWRYSVTVKPFDSSDFAKTTPRKRGQGCFI